MQKINASHIDAMHIFEITTSMTLPSTASSVVGTICTERMFNNLHKSVKMQCYRYNFIVRLQGRLVQILLISLCDIDNFHVDVLSLNRNRFVRLYTRRIHV